MRGGGSLLLSADSEISYPPPYFAGDDHLSISILRWREPQIEMVTSQDSNIKNIDDDRQSRRGTPPAKMSGWFWSGQTNSVADQGKRL